MSSHSAKNYSETSKGRGGTHRGASRIGITKKGTRTAARRGSYGVSW